MQDFQTQDTTAPHPFVPAPTPTPVRPEAPVAKPAVAKVDHLSEIEALCLAMRTANPSGAETLTDKIREHIAAIRDPKAWDAKVAAEKKTADEQEAARAKIRAAQKGKV